MNKDRHVVPHEGGWAVEKSNSERVSSIHRTQNAAINKAISGAWFPTEKAGATVVCAVGKK